MTRKRSIIRLQPGPQRQAACSTADIIFFGGAKGGGKSHWGLTESAKHFRVPGHSSLIFRRTYPELTGDGSLWDESQKLYPLLGGVPTESKLSWSFPSSKRVQMRHLQRVADAYAWNGKNIGDILLEELPYFTEEQFWVLLSCQRSMVGGWRERPRVRATMNPDPDSWVLKFVEPYLDEHGFADPAMSGVVRWFGRRSGELQWYASKQDAVTDGIALPKSFTFIPSKVTDNKILLEQRPDYLANLQGLPPIMRARYESGNWYARPQAGDFFREDWFPIRGDSELAWAVNDHPTDRDILFRYRVWDLASTPWKGDTVLPGTPAREDGDEPAWTRGGLFALCRDGRLVLLDMRGWRDSPGPIEAAMIRTAKEDGPTVQQVIPNDPGQAGDYQVQRMTDTFRAEARVELTSVRATKGKEEYAAVASRLAHAGKILVQRRPWNGELFRELEAFPRKEAHKDQVDVLAQGVIYALEHPRAPWALTSPGQSRGERMMHLDLNVLGRGGML